jgi:hypothetical protein
MSAACGADLSAGCLVVCADYSIDDRVLNRRPMAVSKKIRAKRVRARQRPPPVATI